MKRKLSKMRFVVCFGLFLELFGWLLLLAPPTYAHSEDATLQLSNVSAGPYYLSVWTYPGILRAGTIHFMVAVNDATRTPALTAQVLVQVSPFEGANRPVVGQAVPGLDPHNQLLYETDLHIEKEGVYQVTVVVAGMAGEQGEVTFEIEVVSATLMKGIIYLFLAQALLVSLWFLRESLRTWGLDRALNRNKVAWEMTRARRPFRRSD